MFLCKDKTILDISYAPKGVCGYVLSDALERKVKALYPNFDLILDDDGALCDIIPTKPPKENMALLQNEKQEQNKEALADFLDRNPLEWQDGKFYGVSQNDQNEMSLNLMQYQLAVSAGQEAALLWHATKEACREFSVEEYTALSIKVAAYITPYLRRQEQIKEAIFKAETKEQLEAVEIDYEKLT